MQIYHWSERGCWCWHAEPRKRTIKRNIQVYVLPTLLMLSCITFPYFSVSFCCDINISRRRNSRGRSKNKISVRAGRWGDRHKFPSDLGSVSTSGRARGIKDENEFSKVMNLDDSARPSFGQDIIKFAAARHPPVPKRWPKSICFLHEEAPVRGLRIIKLTQTTAA